MSTRPLERPNNPSPVSQTVKVTGEAIEVAEIPYGDLGELNILLVELLGLHLDGRFWLNLLPTGQACVMAVDGVCKSAWHPQNHR
jgi:hypothetical protein